MLLLPALVTPLHLGALHPYEQFLVLLVAFGPFVVLAFVVRRARRKAIEGAIAAESDGSNCPEDGSSGQLLPGEPGTADLTLASQRLVEDPVDE